MTYPIGTVGRLLGQPGMEPYKGEAGAGTGSLYAFFIPRAMALEMELDMHL